MKLDEIKDIEIFRLELKKKMVKCIKTHENNLVNYTEGEYYHFREVPEDAIYYVYANDKYNRGYSWHGIYDYFEFYKEV